MATHCSVLAWRIPWTEEPGGLQSMGLQRVGLDWAHRQACCIWGFLGGLAGKESPAMWETWVWSLGWEDPLEKGNTTHSSILAWRIPWTIQSMGCQRVEHDSSTLKKKGSCGEGNGNPLHYSCLENPMGRGAWKATVEGVLKNQTHLSHFHFHFMEWFSTQNSLS